MTCQRCGSSGAERSGTSMVLGAQVGSVIGCALTVAIGGPVALVGLLAGAVAGGIAGDKVGENCDGWLCRSCRGPADGGYAGT